jgi:hypothetical protein
MKTRGPGRESDIACKQQRETGTGSRPVDCGDHRHGSACHGQSHTGEAFLHGVGLGVAAPTLPLVRTRDVDARTKAATGSRDQHRTVIRLDPHRRCHRADHVRREGVHLVGTVEPHNTHTVITIVHDDLSHSGSPLLGTDRWRNVMHSAETRADYTMVQLSAALLTAEGKVDLNCPMNRACHR